MAKVEKFPRVINYPPRSLANQPEILAGVAMAFRYPGNWVEAWEFETVDQASNVAHQLRRKHKDLTVQASQGRVYLLHPKRETKEVKP